MLVMVSLQNKVAIIPFVEFASSIFRDCRHCLSIVVNTFPLLDQVQECCFPIGHLDTDFLEDARWNRFDDYRVHLAICLPSPRLSAKNVVEADDQIIKPTMAASQFPRDRWRA
jgi:hypothetical protein